MALRQAAGPLVFYSAGLEAARAGLSPSEESDSDYSRRLLQICVFDMLTSRTGSPKVVARLRVGAVLLAALAVAAPRSAEEIAEERLEDLVEEISTSTMESDHHRIEFVAADFWHQFRCEARLRKSNVALISRRDGTYLAPTPTYAVIPKADFEVTAVRKRWCRHTLHARFQVAGRRLNGAISEEAFNRYTRWKH